jgi:hypothetical protein
MLYIFRTILVHHQEQLYKLYIPFGICRYHTTDSGLWELYRHYKHICRQLRVIFLFCRSVFYICEPLTNFSCFNFLSGLYYVLSCIHTLYRHAVLETQHILLLVFGIHCLCFTVQMWSYTFLLTNDVHCFTFPCNCTLTCIAFWCELTAICTHIFKK